MFVGVEKLWINSAVVCNLNTGKRLENVIFYEEMQHNDR
jgi:hypothetical protein